MSRRKTGAENPCPPPASAGPLFDPPPPEKKPDRRVELLQLVRSTIELVDRLREENTLDAMQATRLYAKLVILDAKCREVPRG